MRKTQILMLAVCALGFLTGCGTSVILVPAGTPVQLAEPVKAHVFIIQKDGTKIKSENRVDIPAGWWAADVPEDHGSMPRTTP
jgi:hypothetical protein